MYISLKPGRWHNGSALVFCLGDCHSNPSQVPPMHMCMWGSDQLHNGHQEVGTCSTRGGSWGMYITFGSVKKWIRQNPLWLWNPEEMSPEIQNRGTSGPQKGHVSSKTFKNLYFIEHSHVPLWTQMCFCYQKVTHLWISSWHLLGHFLASSWPHLTSEWYTGSEFFTWPL